MGDCTNVALLLSFHPSLHCLTDPLHLLLPLQSGRPQVSVSSKKVKVSSCMDEVMEFYYETCGRGDRGGWGGRVKGVAEVTEVGGEGG